MPELTRWIIGCPGCDSRIAVSVHDYGHVLAFHAELRRQVLLDGWQIVDDVPYCPGCAQ